MEKNYKKIKNIYRYLSVLNPTSNNLGISYNTLSEFINRSQLLADNDGYGFSDIDINLILMNSSISKKILRHQFFEFICRTANEKFLNRGITNNLHEGVEKLLDEFFIKSFLDFETDKWKVQRLFNYECEKVFKDNFLF